MGRDRDRFRRQLDFRLLVGFVVLLLVVGDGLIYWLYGGWAALAGLACVGVGAGGLGLLWALLTALEWLGDRTGQW